MGKKKKHRKAEQRQYAYFSRYAKQQNDAKMEYLRDDLKDMIKKIEKEDKKFRKTKTKLKKNGVCVVDLEDHILERPYGTRRSFVELFNSTDFLEVLRYLAKNGKALLVVVAQMIATLIVLVLGCKKLRETIPVKTLRRMQKTYDVCSNIG